MKKSKAAFKDFFIRKNVWLKNKFPKYAYTIISKVLTVAISSGLILLVLRLFGYELTLINLASSVAIYFVYEELEIQKVFQRLSR